MKKKVLVILALVPLLVHLNSCNSSGDKNRSEISKDRAVIAKGELLFSQNCSGCHGFMQDGIGPQLGGLTDEVTVDWIHNFIADPKKMLESGDERSSQLHEKFKAPMPSFSSLTDDEVNNIIAFMHTHKKPQPFEKGDNKKTVLDPIPDSITFSNLVVDLKLISQITPSIAKTKSPLTRITKLDYRPGTNDLFVVDLRGKLYRMNKNDPFVYMDLAKLKPNFIDKPGLGTGFGSFAFHPDFENNGYLYTTHTESPNSEKADFAFSDTINVTVQWVLTEWKAKKPNSMIFSGSSQELLRINMVTGIHGVQEITFNPTSKKDDKDYGLLYIGVGDGGSVNEGHSSLAKDKDKIWGTILRIDPTGNNSANGHYGIPSGNPFVKNNHASTPKEVYAMGFRNPHRITWTKSGDMLASNIGARNIESLNLILAGHDYGWPIREGSFVINPKGNLDTVYQLPTNDSIYNFTYPIAQYDHSGGGLAISGGFDYEGSIPQLKGHFLFGDIPLGKLFHIKTSTIEQGKQSEIKEWRITLEGKPTTLKNLCGSNRVDLHFGRDAKGELYIFTKADGKIYKLISATLDDVSNN